MADESAEVTLNDQQQREVRVRPAVQGRRRSPPPRRAARTRRPRRSTSSRFADADARASSRSAQTASQTVDLRPVNVDNRQELAVTDPIRTDASSTSTSSRSRSMCACAPARPRSRRPTCASRTTIGRAHAAWGSSCSGSPWSGDRQTIVDDQRSRPSSYGASVRPPRRCTSGSRARPTRHHGPHNHHHGPGGRKPGGLRIRVTD